MSTNNDSLFNIMADALNPKMIEQIQQEPIRLTIDVKSWTTKSKYPCPKCSAKLSYPDYTCKPCNIKIVPTMKF